MYTGRKVLVTISVLQGCYRADFNLVSDVVLRQIIQYAVTRG